MHTILFPARWTVTRSQIKTDYVRLFSVIVLFLCLTEVPKIDMSQELWGTTKKNIKKSSCVGPKNSVLTSWKVHRSDIYIIYFIDLVVLKVWHTNISLLKLIVLNLVKHNNWTNMALVSSWQKWPWIWLDFYTNSHKSCTFSICKG